VVDFEHDSWLEFGDYFASPHKRAAFESFAIQVDQVAPGHIADEEIKRHTLNIPAPIFN